MKIKLKYNVMYYRWIFIAWIAILGACQQKETAEEIYVCPMHPTVVRNHQDVCPVCGMDLVRKSTPGQGTAIADDIVPLIHSSNEGVMSKIKTTHGEFKSMQDSGALNGVVAYDPKHVTVISTRVAGRVEKLYLKFQYQTVRAGQKIAEVYSPELVSSQNELLLLMEKELPTSSLIDAAKDKLIREGMSETQIREIIKQKKPQRNMIIFSPASGILIEPEKTTSDLPSPMATNNMSGSATVSDNNAQQSLLLREGDYVTAGQSLFRIVNISDIRVEFDMRATMQVAIGDSVHLNFGDNDLRWGRIDFIEPFQRQGNFFTKVRVFTNSSDLHLGHLASARFILHLNESLWVPKTAVYDLGTRRVVFVKRNNSFTAREIETGQVANDRIEIKTGLASSDEIAIDAQYMMDSESFIKRTN